MFFDPRTGPLRLSAVYYLKTDLTMAINCGLRRKNRYDCQDRRKSAIYSSMPTFGPTPASPRSQPARDGPGKGGTELARTGSGGGPRRAGGTTPTGSRAGGPGPGERVEL